MKKVQVYLPEQVIEMLKEQADQRGISMSEKIRRILGDHCYGDK